MKQIYLNNKDKRTLEKILDYKDGYKLEHYLILGLYIGQEEVSSILYCKVIGYLDLKKIYISELPLWLRLKIRIKGMM